MTTTIKTPNLEADIDEADYNHRAHVAAVAELGAACTQFALAEMTLAQIYSRGEVLAVENVAHDIACRDYDRALRTLAHAHAAVARYIDVVDGVDELDGEDGGDGVPCRRPS